jgi:hypothetical protein
MRSGESDEDRQDQADDCGDRDGRTGEDHAAEPGGARRLGLTIEVT